MSSVPLDGDELAALDRAFVFVADLQIGRVERGGRPAQLRGARELAEVGFPADLMEFARERGFSGMVSEYRTPGGEDGWEFEVNLTRGGVRWRRVMHVGPETWRECGWRVVPEMV